MSDFKDVTTDQAFTKNTLYGRDGEMTYGGALSFLRRKYTKNLEGVDITVSGIPFDAATSFRPGARFGPKAIREASVQLAELLSYPDGIDPFKTLAVTDYGDCELDYGFHSNVVSQIEAHAKTILDSGTEMLTFGGDHFITYPLLRAHAEKFGPIALVHFDAHTDCYEKLDHFLGAIKSAAHWASYLVKQGNVDPTTSTQIGIRGNPRTLDWLQASYDIGYQVITMEEYRKLRHEKCSKMIATGFYRVIH